MADSSNEYINTSDHTANPSNKSINASESISDEYSRLQQAIVSQDRNAIRSILQAREHRSSSLVDSHEEKTHSFHKDSFECPICLNLLYKPCVNTCGHVFCFWCTHTAMNAMGTSKCPTCRNPFTQFAAVFVPLHKFLCREFEKEMVQREKENVAYEKSIHVQSPLVNMNHGKEEENKKRKQNQFVKSIDVLDFVCVRCREIVSEPVIPACGHMVCRGCVDSGNHNDGTTATTASTGNANRVCCECETPILDGVGGPSGELAVCSILDPIISQIYQMDSDLPQATVEHAKQKQRETVDTTPSASSTSNQDVQQPTPRKDSSEDFVHFGVGCDACGIFPIVGRAYHCLDCPGKFGYDLCQSCCIDRRVHLKARTGRFNQTHDGSTHRLKEVKQIKNEWHIFMMLHPELTPAQIMHLLQMQNGDDEED